MSTSMLFVPATAPEKFRKARAAGTASALIVDMEDSVAPDAKEAGRQGAVEMLRGDPSHDRQPLWVRVNALESGLLLQDLAAIVPVRPFGIVLPKCCGSASLEPVAHYLDALETAAGIERGSIQILAIATETAQSMFHFSEYTGCTERLWGMTWGGEDLGADLGASANRDERGYTDPFRLARSLCLFGARAAGVRAIDSVCVAIHDADNIRQESSEAFRDGFVGKMAIHPAQIAPIHEGFTASAQQLDWARRVVAAFDANPGQGAFQLDGKMVDVPHLKLAHKFLGRGAA